MFVFFIITITLCILYLFPQTARDTKRRDASRKLIGITGFKYSGKDTVAQIIQTKLNYEIKHFADPLKKACAVLFNLNNDQLHGADKEIIDPCWGVTPRQILQFVGTDLFRDQIHKLIPNTANNFWTRLMESKLERATTPIIISDLRFKNEEELIHKFNGIIIRVDRNVEKNGYSQHQSESSIHDIDADIIINNNGTINDLECAIDNIIQYIL